MAEKRDPDAPLLPSSTPDAPESLADKWLRRVKNNRIVATLIIAGVAIIGGSKVYEAWVKLPSLRAPTVYEHSNGRFEHIQNTWVESLRSLPTLSITYDESRRDG